MKKNLKKNSKNTNIKLKKRILNYHEHISCNFQIFSSIYDLSYKIDENLLKIYVLEFLNISNFDKKLNFMNSLIEILLCPENGLIFIGWIYVLTSELKNERNFDNFILNIILFFHYIIFKKGYSFPILHV